MPPDAAKFSSAPANARTLCALIHAIASWALVCVSFASLPSCGDRGPLLFRLGDTHKLSNSVEVVNNGNSCVVFFGGPKNFQLMPDTARHGCINEKLFRVGDLVVGAVETGDDSMYFFSLNLATAETAIFEDLESLNKSPAVQAMNASLPPVEIWTRGNLFRK